MSKKDLTNHSANVFGVFQGLRYYNRRRAPLRNTVTQAAGRNHPVLCKMEPFTAPHTNSCRETARDRMFCHLSSQLSAYFHSHIWKVTSTCSSWGTGKASCKMSNSITSGWRKMDKLCMLALTCITDGFFRNK